MITKNTLTNIQQYDTLERLKTVSGFNNDQWFDLLHMNWKDYTKVRANLSPLPENAVVNLANHFKFSPEMFHLGQLDFQNIQIASEKSNWELPDQYSRAQHGRSRSTIAFYDYLETNHGWQIRYETIKHLSIGESILTNPYDPISMKIVSDTMDYLSRRQFRTKDFFAMGIYTHIENCGSVLGKFFSELKTPRAIIEQMIGECLQFYEKNCIYNFISLDENTAIVEVKSNPHVADEMGVQHLGNEQICWAKAGWFASAPIYLGLPPLRVVKTHCEHRGDCSCRYEVHFT